MAFLKINGYEVPVRTDPNPSRTPKRTGEIGTAFDGSPLGTSQGKRRTWKYKTAPLTREEGAALESILLGEGDIWRFENSLFSVKGQPGIFTRAGVATIPGGSQVGVNQPRYVTGATGYGKAILIEDGTIEGCSYPETLTLPSSFLGQEGCIEFVAEMTATTKRQTAGVYPGLISIGKTLGDTSPGLVLYHKQDSANWVSETRDDLNVVSSLQFADSLTPNGVCVIRINYSFAKVEIFSNGTSCGTITSPKLPSGWTAATLGKNGNDYANTYFSNIYFGMVPIPISINQIPVNNLPFLNFSGDVVNRTDANPLVCIGEIDNIEYLPFGAVVKESIEFTLRE